TMHRTHVVTWANLQHGQMHTMKEFEEYTGEHLNRVYTTDDKLELTRPYLYRILDEILLSVDMYESANNTWVPTPKPQIYAQYEMMLPYVRRVLQPHGAITQGSDLMRHIEENPELYARQEYFNLT